MSLTTAPELAAIARQGLDRHEGRKQRVIVVGAGMAGLVTACRYCGLLDHMVPCVSFSQLCLVL